MICPQGLVRFILATFKAFGTWCRLSPVTCDQTLDIKMWQLVVKVRYGASVKNRLIWISELHRPFHTECYANLKVHKSLFYSQTLEFEIQNLWFQSCFSLKLASLFLLACPFHSWKYACIYSLNSLTNSVFTVLKFRKEFDVSTFAWRPQQTIILSLRAIQSIKKQPCLHFCCFSDGCTRAKILTPPLQLQASSPQLQMSMTVFSLKMPDFNATTCPKVTLQPYPLTCIYSKLKDFFQTFVKAHLKITIIFSLSLLHFLR